MLKKLMTLDAMQEQLSSAREARDTSEKLLGEENYSESIKESGRCFTFKPGYSGTSRSACFWTAER